MKKLLTVLIVLSMTLSMLSLPAHAAAFPDIEGHWAQADIEAMAQAGYLNGYPDGTFRPDEPVTRAEFAKIICEAFDYATTAEGWRAFPDIEPGEWYAPYAPAYWTLVDWQLIKIENDYGWPEQLGNFDEYFYIFDANRPLTRIEAAQAIHYSTGVADGSEDDLCFELASGAADSADFIDNRGIAVLIGEVMIKGIMNGDGQGNFRPYETITRAEVCTIINRAITNGDRDNFFELIEMNVEYFNSIAEDEEAFSRILLAIQEGRLEDIENELDKMIIATVNGEPVSMADFDLLFYAQTANLWYILDVDWMDEPYYGSEPEFAGMTMGQIVTEGVLELLTKYAVLRQKASEYGIYDENIYRNMDIAQEIQDQMEYYGSPAAYEYWLDSIGASDLAMVKYIMLADFNHYAAMKLRDMGLLTVTDEDVNDNYIKASHVLIMTDGGTSEEEALAKANEVIERLKAGEDMADLIAEYGEDPGMEYQDYYIFTEGEMVEPFYEGAKALAPGEFSSEPVKTYYGYHVIFRYPISVDDIKNAARSLEQSKLEQLENSWLEEADVQIDDDAVEQAVKSIVRLMRLARGEIELTYYNNGEPVTVYYNPNEPSAETGN